jgi:hypothetical protein
MLAALERCVARMTELQQRQRVGTAPVEVPGLTVAMSEAALGQRTAAGAAGAADVSWEIVKRKK